VTISHLHCRVTDLPGAVDWFAAKFRVAPSFSSARMAVVGFGAVALILDAASDDSHVTIGFSSDDCAADFEALVARGAQIVQPPQDRPYGARVAYLQGPGRLTIEIEQMLSANG
jgi:predicted enzyme related to lactoylglutathione lyase